MGQRYECCASVLTDGRLENKSEGVSKGVLLRADLVRLLRSLLDTRHDVAGERLFPLTLPGGEACV